MIVIPSLQKNDKNWPHTTSQSLLPTSSFPHNNKPNKMSRQRLLFLLLLKSTKPTFWLVRITEWELTTVISVSDFQIKRNSNPSRQNNEIWSLSVYLSWKFELHKILLDALCYAFVEFCSSIPFFFIFSGGSYITGNDKERDTGAAWFWWPNFRFIQTK